MIEPTSPGTAPVRALTRLIALHPSAPVNYLLRGEEWLACGRDDLARADLEAARSLALRELETNAWGYLSQAYIDRADAGLRQCPGSDGAAHGVGTSGSGLEEQHG